MNIIVDCTLFTQLFVLLLLCWIVFILAYNDMTNCDEDEEESGELIAEPQVSTLGLIPSFTRFHFCGFPDAEYLKLETEFMDSNGKYPIVSPDASVVLL